MGNRLREINVDENDLSIPGQKIEKGKVKVIILDGHQGTAKETYAVEHGNTSLETVKGAARKVRWVEEELF